MEIRPFRGWRYKGDRDGDVSSFIAPPYDVLSGEDKKNLLAGSDRNIVAVDLPHVPPKEVGPDSEYLAAAEMLRQWKASGVLVQEAAPAIYAYAQTFAWSGRTFTRRAILCGVRATPFGQDVIPHEHTFAGPKADRLKLTELTKTYLSPIFGFYNDPTGEVSRTVFSPGLTLAAHGHLRGVEERLYAVTDPAVIAKTAQLLKNLPVYIADGHHRYTTAMNYSDSLRKSGAIDASHEANFVLFALVDHSDPGMKILPTHRVFRGLKKDFTLEKMASAAKEFEWKKLPLGKTDLTDADDFLAPFGSHAMGFIPQGAAEIWIARLKDAEAMKAAAPDEMDAWRQLDVAILHKLVIEKALKPFIEGEPAIEYTPDGNVAAVACTRDAQLAAILQSTPLKAVEDVANAGGTMPHKSTYFYPKLSTGIVLKPLE